MSSIVVDNGTGFMKAGFVGDTEPSTIFPTTLVDFNCRPMEYGVIKNFDNMEKIWHHIFTSELKIIPEESSVLMTDCLLNPKADREKLVQIMFEGFNFKRMYIYYSSILSLYASGIVTGVVIDSGYDQTQIVPIYEGYAMSHTIKTNQFGGKHCTEYLKEVLFKQNINIQYVKEINQIKERFCYIAKYGANQENKKAICSKPEWLISAYLRNIDCKYSDYTSIDIEEYFKQYCGDINQFVIKELQYKLPDGSIIKLGKEQWKCSELIFKNKQKGMIELLNESRIECDPDIIPDVFGNIVCCGGNTMFNGLSERLKNEIKYNPVKIIAPNNRNISQWVGGSIVVSSSTFEEIWMSKEEYNEAGPAYVHRHCS